MKRTEKENLARRKNRVVPEARRKLVLLDPDPQPKTVQPAATIVREAYILIFILKL